MMNRLSGMFRKSWLIAMMTVAVCFVMTASAQAVLIDANGQVWSLNTDAPTINFYNTSRASDGSPNTWVTNANWPDYFNRYSAPVLMMDLGDEVEINSLAFWNYSTGNSNDTSEFSLRFGTAAEGPLGVGNSITYNPTFNPLYGGPTIQEDLALTQSVTARYVEVTASDNYRGMPPNEPGGDRVGFADLQFDVTTAPTFQAPLARARPTATENGNNPNSMLDGNTGTQWFSVNHNPDYFAVGPDPVLVIDMGTEQTVDGFDFWNYTIAGNRVQDFSLSFATESEGPASFGSSITYNPSFTVANETNTVQQSLDFSEPVTARYVEITLTDNYYEAGAGGDRVGFSEIDFRNVEPDLPYLEVLTPIAATSSTDATDFFKVGQLIDDDSGNQWVTAGGGDYYDKYHAPILTFDIGEDRGLTGLEFGNYTIAGNATSAFALAFATEADGPDGFGDSIDYYPIFHPLVNGGTIQDLSFDEMVTARYVQMIVLDNYDHWAYAGGDRVGFAHIAFHAVPEPSSLTLAALSICILGGWRLRRRKLGSGRE